MPRATSALVRNATSPAQVRNAERKVRDRRAHELAELKAVLGTEHGRRVIWRFLQFCGVHQTVLRADPLEMAAAAGRQNVGHYVMAEVEAADDQALFVMMREDRVATARENREIDALHTPGVTKEQTDGED